MSFEGSLPTGLGSVPTAAGAPDGGTPGTIDEIESSDGSIRVRNPLGAVVDLSLESGLTAADISAMPAAGGLGWIFAPGKLLPTNNQDPRACNATCAVTAAGKVRTTGPVELPFTTVGGKPINGQQCWVAASTDDSSTGQGKCTATKPGVGLPPESLPAAHFPQNVGRVGIVLDNGNYDALKTCTVLLDLQAAPNVIQPPDQNWVSKKLDHTSRLNFMGLFGAIGEDFRLGPPGAGTVVPGTDPTVGASMVVWFTVDHLNAPITIHDIISCAYGNTQQGWSIMPYASGTFRLQFLDGFADAGSLFLSAPPGPGVNYVAFSVRGDGTMAGSLNGRPIQYGAWTSITKPAANNKLCIGGGYNNSNAAFNGWSPGGVLGCAMIQRPLRDDELVALAEFLPTNGADDVPNVPDPAKNPFTLPATVTADPALGWYWLATDWDGSSATSPVHVGTATPFVLTVNGAPTLVDEKTTWLRSLAGKYVDTKPVLYDSRGYPRPSVGTRLAFTVGSLADLCNIVIGWTCDDVYNFDNGGWAVFVTPAGGARITMSPVRSDAAIVDGNIHYVTMTSLLATTPPDAASYYVEIVSGDRIFFDQTYEVGGNIADLVVPTSAVFDTDVTARRLVLVGADEHDGHDAGLQATTPMSNSALSLLRTDYPGRVVHAGATSFGAGAALRYGNTLSVAPYARRIFELATAGGLPARIDLVFMLGFYGDYHAAEVTVAQYTALYAQLVDAVHALLPDSGHGGVTHYQMWKSIQASYDATANGNGETLAQFDTAAAAIAAARPWITFKNPRGPNAITFSGGAAIPNAQPTQSGGGGAGALALKANGKVALGY